MPTRDLISGAPELRLDPAALGPGTEWPALLGDDGPFEIEVGIGKGRFLLAAAESRPDVRHLGVEWANKYLRFAEARALRRGLKNVRFLRMDVNALLPSLPDAGVDAFYVFYPDPWPKKRHHKRRFFRPSTLEQLERILRPGGLLHAATDHLAYWEAIESVMSERPRFERLPEFGGASFPLPTDQPLTNFEAKYLVDGRKRFRASWRLKGND